MSSSVGAGGARRWVEGTSEMSGVERCWPTTAHARHSETPNRSRSILMALRLRFGVSSVDRSAPGASGFQVAHVLIGGERGWVVCSEHPDLVRKELFVELYGSLVVSDQTGLTRDVLASDKCRGVIDSEHPNLVGKDALEELYGLLVVSDQTGLTRDVVAGGKSGGVIGPEHPNLVVEDALEELYGLLVVSDFSGLISDVVPSGEGGGVVRFEYPDLVVE